MRQHLMPHCDTDLQDQEHSVQDEDHVYSYKLNWNIAAYEKRVTLTKFYTAD